MFSHQQLLLAWKNVIKITGSNLSTQITWALFSPGKTNKTQHSTWFSLANIEHHYKFIMAAIPPLPCHM